MWHSVWHLADFFCAFLHVAQFFMWRFFGSSCCTDVYILVVYMHRMVGVPPERAVSAGVRSVVNMVVPTVSVPTAEIQQHYLFWCSYLVPTHLVTTHLVSTFCQLLLLFTHNLL